jgi:hypothetical protein
VRLVQAHLPDTQYPLAQELPRTQESVVQVPAPAPEQRSERPQFESCVQVAVEQVPGAKVQESLPHWLPRVHLQIPPLHVPSLQVVVQVRGEQVPATTVPLQV